MGKYWKKADPFWKYAIVVTAVFVLFLFLKRDGLVSWVRAGFTIRRQQREIEYYESEISRLDLQSGMRASDRDTLEKFARETYGFAEPGDDVYKIR